jgi:hypothetical protein
MSNPNQKPEENEREPRESGARPSQPGQHMQPGQPGQQGGPSQQGQPRIPAPGANPKNPDRR